jgi:hypothetical protein
LRVTRFLIINIEDPAFQLDDIIGRDISLALDIMLAKRWILDYIDNHSECASNLNPALPTRVLDVGLSNGNQEPRLILGHGIQGPYIALSHYWGSSKPLVTNIGNIQEHLTTIPFQGLPQTFQDAVTITRRLSYRFLWIDSLCIIQDSPEDWQNECTKMSDIYKNAVVIITGLAAKDSSCGFLGDRKCSYQASCSWNYQGRHEWYDSPGHTSVRVREWSLL